MKSLILRLARLSAIISRVEQKQTLILLKLNKIARLLEKK